MINNLKIKSNVRIYLAPYSAMTKTLRDILIQDYNIHFKGFIDKNRESENVYKIDKVLSDYDYIFIVSPNYGYEIYKDYKKYGIKRNKIKVIDYSEDKGFFETSFLKMRIKSFTKEKIDKTQKFLYKNIKSTFEDKNSVMFLAPDFIDINIKDLYVYLSSKKELKIVIATNNKLQKRRFKKYGFNVVGYPSLKFFYLTLKSKIKIMDHSPIKKEELNSLINSKTVQIWHGIALKKIGHMVDYKKVKYDIVVSTSDFVSEYSFGKLFDYEKLVNSGYPRNDIFFKNDISKKSLVLVEQNIYNYLKDLNKKIVVYMPTWRPDNTSINPIDLSKLNDFAEKNNIFVLIKTHPFTREDSFHDSSLDSSKYLFESNYKKSLMFYPTTDDIYPILKFSSILITDYSSIYFDYLLLDKPIIFFVFDKEYYINNHGDFMLEFEEHTPGEKAETIEQLEMAIIQSIQNDNYKHERIKLKDKLFEKQDGSSCETLFREVIRLKEL